MHTIVYFKRLDSRQNELKMYIISIWSRKNGYYAKLIHAVFGKNDRQVISLYLINFEILKVWLWSVWVFIVPHVACFKVECERFL